MLEERLRGGERYDLSVLPKSPVDVTEKVNEVVEDILQRGLEFVRDRVELRFHKTVDIQLSDGTFVSSKFYPLDKKLTQTEVESINLWLLGLGSFFNTRLVHMSECIANHIMKQISGALDKQTTGKLIVHFSPGDSVVLANTIALPAYGRVVSAESGYKAELETSFYIEAIYD